MSQHAAKRGIIFNSVVRETRILMRKLLILTLTMSLSLLAAPALAGAASGGPMGDQDSAVVAQYGVDPVDAPLAAAGPSTETAGIVPATSGTAGLPFTGLNLATVLLVGLFLIAGGALLRAGLRVRRASGLTRS